MVDDLFELPHIFAPAAETPSCLSAPNRQRTHRSWQAGRGAAGGGLSPRLSRWKWVGGGVKFIDVNHQGGAEIPSKTNRRLMRSTPGCSCCSPIETDVGQPHSSARFPGAVGRPGQDRKAYGGAVYTKVTTSFFVDFELGKVQAL